MLRRRKPGGNFSTKPTIDTVAAQVWRISLDSGDAEKVREEDPGLLALWVLKSLDRSLDPNQQHSRLEVRRLQQVDPLILPREYGFRLAGLDTAPRDLNPLTVISGESRLIAGGEFNRLDDKQAILAGQIATHAFANGNLSVFEHEHHKWNAHFARGNAPTS